MTHKGSVEYTAGRSFWLAPIRGHFGPKRRHAALVWGRKCLVVSTDRVWLILGNRYLDDHWADFVMAE